MELTNDERQKLTKCFIKYNLAVVLADVADTLMLDFESESNKFGKELKHEYKYKFSLMKQSAKSFKIRVKDIAREGYNIQSSDTFCEDSDWLCEMLQLIIDRTGDNREKMLMLRAMVFNMKSEMNLFN